MKHAILLALLLAAAPAWAAAPILHDTDKQVDISALKMEADIKSKVITYSGDVRAVQGGIQMRADAMKADQPNQKIYAIGKVLVDSPTSGTVTGNNGIYDLVKKIVTMSGNVVLTKKGEATIRGSLLTVNMVTGQAQLSAQAVAGNAGQAAAPGVPGGRVQGVFTPKAGSQ